MRRPLICSDVMADQVKDAAITFDPDDAAALAQAMTDALNDDTAKRLVANGIRRLKELSAARDAAELRFSQSLQRFARRRSCW